MLPFYWVVGAGGGIDTRFPLTPQIQTRGATSSRSSDCPKST
jgi:hypothetical protein